MANIRTSMQTTMNRAKPADDQPLQENEVIHEATYGRMPAEWAHTVATLSAVNRVLLASGQRHIGYQMERTYDTMSVTAPTNQLVLLNTERYLSLRGFVA